MIVTVVLDNVGSFSLPVPDDAKEVTVRRAIMSKNRREWHVDLRFPPSDKFPAGESVSSNLGRPLFTESMK